MKLSQSEVKDLASAEGFDPATLLTDDPELQIRIESHPLLRWKAQNVRRHKVLE